MINKIIFRWKNTGLPRSLQITSSEIPPVKLPSGCSAQECDSILTLGNSKWKGTFLLYLPTHGQEKKKIQEQSGVVWLPEFLSISDLIVLLKMNMGPGREGTWQIIHKTSDNTALAMGSVPSVSLMWKLMNFFRFCGRGYEQIKEFSVSPIVKLHMRNWGWGRQIFRVGRCRDRSAWG